MPLVGGMGRLWTGVATANQHEWRQMPQPTGAAATNGQSRARATGRRGGDRWVGLRGAAFEAPSHRGGKQHGGGAGRVQDVGS